MKPAPPVTSVCMGEQAESGTGLGDSRGEAPLYSISRTLAPSNRPGPSPAAHAPMLWSIGRADRSALDQLAGLSDQDVEFQPVGGVDREVAVPLGLCEPLFRLIHPRLSLAGVSEPSM